MLVPLFLYIDRDSGTDVEKADNSRVTAVPAVTRKIRHWDSFSKKQRRNVKCMY
jgi:hypothetical protein